MSRSKTAWKSSILEEVGKTYNRLTILEILEFNSVKGKSRCLCLCSCGKQHEASLSNIRGGQVKSCGCLRNERVRDTLLKYGDDPIRGNLLYEVFCSLKQRCNNPKAKAYEWYGARGIQCLFQDYTQFRDWAIANGYQKGLSIDRIDNDGPYSPENCRWATVEEQALNKRTSFMVNIQGETITLKEAVAKYSSCKYNTVHSRISKHGWSIEEAIFTPKLAGKRGKSNE